MKTLTLALATGAAAPLGDLVRSGMINFEQTDAGRPVALLIVSTEVTI